MLMVIKLKRNISLGLHLLLRWEPIDGSLFEGPVTCPSGLLEKVSMVWAAQYCET